MFTPGFFLNSLFQSGEQICLFLCNFVTIVLRNFTLCYPSKSDALFVRVSCTVVICLY